MIDGQVKSQLPDVRPMSEIMAKLALRLGKDVLYDAGQGGNPQWQPRIFPSGAAQLNYISRTLQTYSTQNTAVASWSNGLVYGWVHELGMEINRTEKMRGFFWAKWYETGEEFWKNMALSRKPTTSIPARPILPGILSRSQQYAEFVGKNIIITRFKGEEENG